MPLLTVKIYGGFLISIVIGYLLGQRFTRVSIWHSFLAGIFIQALILCISARFYPNYTSQLIVLFTIASIVFAWLDKNEIRNQLASAISWNKLFYLAFFIVFSFIFLRNLDLFHYHFESHDVLYFGPAIEMFLADYTGNLASLISFPDKLAATHLLHSAIVAILSFFVPEKLNLIIAVQLRYCFVALNLGCFLYYVYNYITSKFSANHVYTLFLMYLALVIYGDVLTVIFQISSFPYAVLCFSILCLLFSTDEPIDLYENLLLFSIMLIACKAPIAYVAVIACCWILLSHLYVIKSKKCFFVGLLVAVNVATWIIIPSNYYSGFDLSFLNMLYLTDWTVEHNFKHIIKLILTNKVLTWGLVLSLFVFIRNFVQPKYIAISYLLLALFLIVIIDQSSMSDCFMLLITFLLTYLPCYYLIKLQGLKEVSSKYLLVYMTASLFGLLFIRNGGELIHQVHTVGPSTIFAFFSLILIGVQQKKLLPLIILLFTINCFGNDWTKIPAGQSASDARHYLTLRYQEISSDHFDNYIPPQNEPFWISELKAGGAGGRLNRNHIKTLDYGQLRNFLLK